MSADRITIDPDICHGKPCIRGLRIRVKDVLGLLAAGASHQEILEDYPDLEEADILAALSYAAAQEGIPASVVEVVERLDDIELNEIAEARAGQKITKVKLDDL